MKSIITLFVFVFSFQALGSVVSVVDSGTHFDHDWLKNNIWTNTNEIPGNLIDDDGNGKVDDIVGWNFAENMDKVFWPEHIPQINEEVYELFELVAKVQGKTATKAEQDKFERDIKNLNIREKRKLAARLNFYGQYSHGTHGAGTIAYGNPDAMIQTNRVFPDQFPPRSVGPLDALQPNGRWDWLDPKVWLYNLFSSVNNKQFFDVSQYMKSTQVDVANMSLGVPLKNIVGGLISIFGKPSDERLSKEVHKAYKRFETKGQEWLAESPETLFVVAAGNDGSDNDKFPTFPSNMRADNMISVAATRDDFELADFSNYGKTSVDIAAPGVSIVSAAPGPDTDFTLPMSGTSMAAPIVTMVASKMKDANPDLTPLQMKRLMMETVDKRSWLKGKVVAEGIINDERAVLAAQLMTGVSIEEAVHEAFLQMPHIEEAIVSPRLTQQNTLDPEVKEFVNQIVF